MSGHRGIRIALLIVQAFVAFTAVVGGIALVIGSLDAEFSTIVNPPPEYLAGSPFDSYVIPGLILAVEWPRERFSALVGLVVGINQFTFAFGPSLVGVMRDGAGTDGLALGTCAALQAVAAAVILLGPGRAPS